VLNNEQQGFKEGDHLGTMTHILPPHSDLNLAPSSLHSALHMDHTQQQQQSQQQNSQQQQQNQQQAPQQSTKKRRKADSGSDDVTSPSEPRRLRRSHEACARCRSKKIKASPVGSHRPQISVRLSDLRNSAIRNIRNVLLVLLLVSPASRRIGTDRP
jgi:hypothetical protein